MRKFIWPNELGCIALVVTKCVWFMYDCWPPDFGLVLGVVLKSTRQAVAPLLMPRDVKDVVSQSDGQSVILHVHAFIQCHEGHVQ
jgi:hypothetical protein